MEDGREKGVDGERRQERKKAKVETEEREKRR